MDVKSIIRSLIEQSISEATELGESESNIVARYINKSGRNVLYFEILEKPNGNLYSRIYNQRGINVAASAIDLRSSHAAAKTNVEKATMYYDQDGDSGALRHLNSFLPGWKKVPIQESTKISEATELDHSRYMRAHGKKAKDAGGPAQWMFTSKEMGEPKAGEMVTVSGSLSTAAKEAAKKLRTNRIYVMEEVELDEALDKDYAGMLGKFKKAVDKAEEAKSKGDKEKMSKHLEDARNRLFGMKSTDSAKLKTTDHYDRYNKMKGLKESEALDEDTKEVIVEQFNTEKGEAKEHDGKKYIGLNLMWNGEKFGEVYSHKATSQTKRAGSKVATSQKSVVRWGFRVPGIQTGRYDITSGFSSRDEAAQKALALYKKNMTKESLDEASNSKLDKAMATINARITKPGQPPKYPSFDSAPEDIKAAARNLAKNMK